MRRGPQALMASAFLTLAVGVYLLTTHEGLPPTRPAEPSPTVTSEAPASTQSSMSPDREPYAPALIVDTVDAENHTSLVTAEVSWTGAVPVGAAPARTPEGWLLAGATTSTCVRVTAEGYMDREGSLREIGRSEGGKVVILLRRKPRVTIAVSPVRAGVSVFCEIGSEHTETRTDQKGECTIVLDQPVDCRIGAQAPGIVYEAMSLVHVTQDASVVLRGFPGVAVTADVVGGEETAVAEKWAVTVVPQGGWPVHVGVPIGSRKFRFDSLASDWHVIQAFDEVNGGGSIVSKFFAREGEHVEIQVPGLIELQGIVVSSTSSRLPAEVWLMPLASFPKFEDFTTASTRERQYLQTDSNGVFTVRWRPHGTGSLAVARRGEEWGYKECFIPEMATSTTEQIELHGWARMSGRVANDQGKPIAGARVTAIQLSQAVRRTVAEATCTESGEFQLRLSQRPDPILLQVSAEGYKDRWIAAASQLTRDLELPVTLQSSPSIRIICVDGSGHPAEGVEVTLIDPGTRKQLYDPKMTPPTGIVAFPVPDAACEPRALNAMCLSVETMPDGSGQRITLRCGQARGRGTIVGKLTWDGTLHTAGRRPPRIVSPYETSVRWYGDAFSVTGVPCGSVILELSSDSHDARITCELEPGAFHDVGTIDMTHR